MRKVVLLCGPPGAGKTTAARASGLTVFDRDDERWRSEAHFRDALTALGQRPGAQAVVIRAGATSTTRAKVATLINATQVFVLLADRDELHRRLRARARHDMVATMRGVDDWHARFDRADRVATFPGWAAVDLDQTEPGVTSTDW